MKIIRSKAVFDGVNDTYRPCAVLIEGDRILKILPWDCESDERYSGIPLYDYGEKLILPSFLDAHTHIFGGAVAASDYVCSDLGICHSEEECVELLKAYAATHRDLKRIRGAGWFIGNWREDRLPDKRSLDAAFPDVPVYLQCADAHSMWLNSKALEEAGICPDESLTNGIIETFPDGTLTGMLIEPAAYEPAMDKFMDFTEEEMQEIHEHFQKVLAKNGVSALSEMFADDYTEATYKKYDILRKLDQDGKINAHIFSYTKMFGCTDYKDYFKIKAYCDTPHFHIAGVKGFVDGVTETYTGLLLEPYTDRPDSCGENLPLWPKEKMQQEILLANQEGIQVRLHCIADGSVRMALDMYEHAKDALGKSDVRNTIEHIENIHPDDIGRFEKTDVVASMQPYHVTLSNNDKILRIGAERSKYEWPLGTIKKSGARIAIGTDFPVVGLNPFKTIYAAVTRKDDDGIPTGHNPWETIDIYTALKAYMIDAAYVYHVDSSMGSLEEGKYANLIVLDRNIICEDEEQIQHANIIANWFEGRLVYDRN